MNCSRETVKMGVPPGNHPAVPRDWTRGVPERYVAGFDSRGRPGGRPYPRSQQAIHEISGLVPRTFQQKTQDLLMGDPVSLLLECYLTHTPSITMYISFLIKYVLLILSFEDVCKCPKVLRSKRAP